jgi:hypothetical protein
VSPLVTATIGALTTISTVGGFLLAHAGAIKKEYVMVRTEIASFISAVEAFTVAVNARLAQPAPLSPEETAALADAQAKVVAATAAVQVAP